MGTSFSLEGKMVNLRQRKNKNSQNKMTLFYSAFRCTYLISIMSRLYDGEIDLLQVNLS